MALEVKIHRRQEKRKATSLMNLPLGAFFVIVPENETPYLYRKLSATGNTCPCIIFAPPSNVTSYNIDWNTKVIQRNVSSIEIITD